MLGDLKGRKITTTSSPRWHRPPLNYLRDCPPSSREGVRLLAPAHRSFRRRRPLASCRGTRPAPDDRAARAQLDRVRSPPRRISRADSRFDPHRRWWSASTLRPLLILAASARIPAPLPRNVARRVDAHLPGRVIEMPDAAMKYIVAARDRRGMRRSHADNCRPVRRSSMRGYSHRSSLNRSTWNLPGFFQSNSHRVRYCVARRWSVGEPSAKRKHRHLLFAPIDDDSIAFVKRIHQMPDHARGTLRTIGCLRHRRFSA